MDSFLSVNGHSGSVPGKGIFTDAYQNPHQTLHDLLDRLLKDNRTENLGSFLQHLLMLCTQSQGREEMAAVFRSFVPELGESGIEELLGALLQPEGCRVFREQYLLPGVQTLLTEARVWHPALYERERAKAVTRGWPGRDFDRMVDMLVKQYRIADVTSGPWDKAISVADFLLQTDPTWTTYARDMVFQAGVTFVAAPRGTGKSVVALILGCALATGGRFRGQPVQHARVLLVDRDNPPRIIRERFRNMGADTITGFDVLTREDAPSLLAGTDWQTFPVERYNVVILDSWSAFTEGVSEKQGDLTQRCLAALKDLAYRGPAILVLDNCDKGAKSYRGRGEKADAADVLFEARDISGWTPGTGDWWMDLPEAGDHAWQSRARRRKEQTSLHIVFVASKFRLGIEPKPFALEVNTCSSPWTLRDITSELETLGEETARQETIAQRRQLEEAGRLLRRKIQQRSPEAPMLKKEAERFLREQGLTSRQARGLLNDGLNAGGHPSVEGLILRPIEGQPGNPIGVFLPDAELGVPNIGGLASPYVPRRRDESISDTRSTPDVKNMAPIISSNINDFERAYFGHFDTQGRPKYEAGITRNRNAFRDPNISDTAHAYQLGTEPETGNQAILHQAKSEKTAPPDGAALACPQCGEKALLREQDHLRCYRCGHAPPPAPEEDNA